MVIVSAFMAAPLTGKLGLVAGVSLIVFSLFQLIAWACMAALASKREKINALLSPESCARTCFLGGGRVLRAAVVSVVLLNFLAALVAAAANSMSEMTSNINVVRVYPPLDPAIEVSPPSLSPWYVKSGGAVEHMLYKRAVGSNYANAYGTNPVPGVDRLGFSSFHGRNHTRHVGRRPAVVLFVRSYGEDYRKWK